MNRPLALLISLLLVASFAHSEQIQTYANLSYAVPSADDGEMLIDFENGEPSYAIAGILGRFGLNTAQFAWFSKQENWVRVRGLTARMIERLRLRSDVEIIEPNYYVSALYVPNDPYYKHQWHLDLIGMKQAWDYPSGAPVTVAVIDTGIAYENYKDFFRVEDLADFQFVKPHNFVNGTDHANDDHGHGTHVAGTIAQLTNNGVGVAGVAPNVKLMPLKVLNSYGYGTISDIAAAIRYAADNGASVINMSLGGPFPSFILHKAIRYAHDKGVVIVCAAGNSGRSGLSYPANYEECISVSSVRFDRKLAWYSSYGKGLTIAAPGGDMNVDQNGDGLVDGVLQNTLNPQDRSQQGYFLFQGTSMATPHVAAVAALLISHGITDPDRVTKFLQRTATRVQDGSPQQYGAGVVNAHEAMKSAYLMRNIRIALLALVLLILFINVINRKAARSERISIGLLAVAGTLFSSSGFFFLSRIPLIRNVFALTHPVEEWHFGLLGAGTSWTALSFSFLPALVVLLICYPWRKLISFNAGFALGSASFLLFQAFSPVTRIAWIPGAVFETSWLLINAVLCIALAFIAAFRAR